MLLRRFSRIATIVVPVLLSLVLATTVVAGGRPLKASLTGAAELPAADPDGTGTARVTLNQGRGRVCFWIQVENITLPATAAHIHDGSADVNGPVVVPLGAPDAEGMATGCVDGIAKSLIKDIRQHPADYYVNVHNADYPGGAVRGQLSK